MKKSYHAMSGGSVEGSWKNNQSVLLLAGIAILAVMVFSSCMATPVDLYKLDKTEKITFSGGAPGHDVAIKIRAYYPPKGNDSCIYEGIPHQCCTDLKQGTCPEEGGYWEQIGTATSLGYSTSYFGFAIYPWAKSLVVPDKYWAHECGSSGDILRVRSGYPGTYYTFKEDLPFCFAAHQEDWTDFIAHCSAPDNTVARVITPDYRDFGQECVDKINELRALEGLKPLERAVETVDPEAECCADRNTIFNYYHPAPPHGSMCTSMQNECDSRSSVDGLLQDCLERSMYKDEKACYDKDPTCKTCQCAHYRAITGKSAFTGDYKAVACGLYYDATYDKYVSCQNFYE